MNDTAYTMHELIRERKTLSRNAKYKRNGSKSRRCTLPSDYMTAAQKKRQNGELMSYTMTAPHTYSELKAWPTDLLQEYLDGLVTTYQATAPQLADMMDCHVQTVYRLYDSCGAKLGPKGGRRSAAQQDAWQTFIHPAPVEEEAPAPAEEPASPSGFTWQDMTITSAGDPIAILSAWTRLLEGEKDVTLTITVRRN